MEEIGMSISKHLTNLEELYVVIFFFPIPKMHWSIVQVNFFQKSFSLNALENDVSAEFIQRRKCKEKKGYIFSILKPKTFFF